MAVILVCGHPKFLEIGLLLLKSLLVCAFYAQTANILDFKKILSK